MELNLLHFYPDLMSLYGSYANVALLKRTLEQMGNSVTVQPVLPQGEANIAAADFIFMGAGTERAQKAALADFTRYASALRTAADRGTAMLFAGNAMELLGKTITDESGKEYIGLALAPFTTVQQSERIVGDVYGHTALYDDSVVGFINKSSRISGVTSPLLTTMAMGYGNDAPCSPEGYHERNVFASELTGPILVKNPQLLKVIISAIYTNCNQTMPEIPLDDYLTNGYAITAEQLRLRSEK